MRTKTDIAPSMCNKFANCYLIFAVDEAPAVSISAISFWVLESINRDGELVLVVEMLPCGLSRVADFGRNLGSLRRPILHVSGRFRLGTVSAAAESPADFGSMTYDFRAAMPETRAIA